MHRTIRFGSAPRLPGRSLPTPLPATALIGLAVLAMSACGGGGGASTEANPAGPPVPSSDYTGPAPATADVQSFKLNLYDNVRTNNRCGSCHSVEGGQSPMFARSDDVNLAYGDANGIVTLTSPGDSPIVLKVAQGHNCWLSSDAACADILTTWVTAWAGDLADGGGRKIELEAPALRDPGDSRSFPDSAILFQTHVYPLLADNCSSCHSSSAAVQQSPFFAEGPGSDANAVESAYEAAKARINLDDPAQSRFVVRLRDEAHNCWTASCANDADAMESAIATFAGSVPLSEIDPDLVTSTALTLYEGTVASGGNRYEANVIANYEFKTGQGGTAFDTSGVEPAMDLSLSGAVEWFGGWGLNFSGGKAQATTASSAKLRTLIAATGEYSIEAWVAPGNVVQEDARIVSYSAGTMARNFNLGQQMYSYEFYNRSGASDANGEPRLATPDAAEVLQATLQHVVATYDPVEGRKIYVNGVLVADLDPVPGGTLADWDDTFAFVLGNEVSGDRPFAGVLRLVAIHNRVMTPEQITQNFDAGVGEKFFLLFSVEHLTGVPASYIVFEAAIFDTYAYLFRAPFFISLDPDANPGSIPLQGIRIGLNGNEARVGQAFGKLDTSISALEYDAETGQLLSRLGTVIPLEKGPDSDEFFLSFDRLGANTYARPAPAVPTPPEPADRPPASDIGVRTFAAINATMAAITGVSPLEPDVHDTYTTVRESMPAVATIEAVLASHQVAIAQLAIEYCNALIEDQPLRENLFPAFPFTSSVTTAWPGAGSLTENAFIDPLLDRIVGVPGAEIMTQPDRAAARAELDELIHGIPADSSRPGLAAGGGDALRTQTIAKAVCSAVVGGAAMLVQ